MPRANTETASEMLKKQSGMASLDGVIKNEPEVGKRDM
jgi:hypothetical protein